LARWFKDRSTRNDEVEQLAQAIDDQSAEQKKMLEIFNIAMSNFATDRSLETCLDALNSSMQIANIRGKLVQSYEYYARLLEQEIIGLRKLQGRK